MKVSIRNSVIAWLTRLVLAGLLAPASAFANFFFVESTEDAVDAAPGDGLCADASANCTLRAAIMESNALAGADFIDLGAGTYRLTIPGNAEHAAATGDLDILGPVTIRGIDPASTVIDANGIDRAFELINAGVVSISRLTIANGVAGQNTPGYFANFAGGAVSNVGNGSTVTLTEVEIRDNSARIGGGLFNVFSTMEVRKSSIYNNIATAGSGGGISESLASFLRVYNSTISGNSATMSGGGFHTSNNPPTLRNVTITNNIADSDNDGTGNGGGINRGITAPQLSNSILAGNIDRGGEAPDCSDSISSGGYNIVGNDSGCTVTANTGDQIGTGASPISAALAPLADNGGPTASHALLNGSPALDGGNPAGPGSGGGACEASDQRGILRSAHAPCDAGALESTPSAGADFTVNSTLDQVDALIGDGSCETVPGNNVCTLRAAIQETNALIGEDRVTLPVGVYLLTIPGNNEDASASGDLDITDTLSLSGAGNANSIVDADFLDRVFQTLGNGNVTFSDITIRNGLSTGSYGGGIYHQSNGIITVNDSVITDNSSGSGGGIFSVGFNHVVINRSLLTNNSAVTHGGGLANFTFSTSTINDSTISNNSAATGGGMMNSFMSYALINGTTINNNQARFGGGIGTLWGNGNITLSNSTLSENRASFGGGGINVSSNDIVNLRNTTITGNQAQASADGGGINNSGLVNMRNSIIAGNSDAGGEAPDCAGTLTSQGNNLLGDNTGCSFAAGLGDIYGDSISPVDPLLGPLSDNGGTTLTHALLTGSPAFNAGNSATPGSGGSACEAFDQRGTDRTTNAPCDIGSVESVIADVGITVNADINPVLPGGQLQHTLEVSNLGPDIASQLTTSYSLPDGATLIGTIADDWTCNTVGTLLTCTSDSLAIGMTSTLVLTMSAPLISGHFGSTASVMAGTIDLNASNDTASPITIVNAAPIFNTLSSPVYTLGQTGTFIAEDASVIDPDDSHLESATIRISGGYISGQDALSFIDTATISGYWDPLTGQLTLSGTDTLAAYQLALRSVQYLNRNTAAPPGLRSFIYQVYDGDISSHIVSNLLDLREPAPVTDTSKKSSAAPAPAPAPPTSATQSGSVSFPNNTPEAQPLSPDTDSMSTETSSETTEADAESTVDPAPAATAQAQHRPARATPSQSPGTMNRSAADNRGSSRSRAGLPSVSSTRKPGHSGISGFTPDRVRPTDKKTSATVDPILWTQLDTMKQQLNLASEADDAQEKIIVGTAKTVTVALFAGVVNWYLKAGNLLASLLSSAPLWAPFDPLPILSATKKDRQRKRSGEPEKDPEENENTHLSENMFDDPGISPEGDKT